jgi:hypothetical protein
MLLSDDVPRIGVHHRRKRVSAIAFARSLQQKSDEELERIALDNAHDERTLWIVLDAVRDRRGNGALTLKKQIRDRLILKKPLPVRLRGKVIWTTAVPPLSKPAWYSTLGYVVAIALMIAVAHVAEADARLVELVTDNMRSLGIYLGG